MNFSSLGLLPALTQVCTELGFTEATPIQELALPVLLRGEDLVGQARTGSGKTLAFALPLLQNLDVSRRSPQALILGPTRELVAQVTREIRKVGRSFPGLRVLPLAGGEPIFGQTRALEEGAHILVATPGRLLDHLDRNNVPLRMLKVLVLDEADRMLEMGFAEDLRKILEQLPSPRQTALFSATFPPDIERLSETILNTPVRVVAPEPPPEIQAWAWDPAAIGLIPLLLHLNPASALIFCNFKASASALAEELAQAGLPVGCLQGDMEQWVRDQELARFRSSVARILVATDVAARGLDISGLELVVNLELPHSPDLYLHRIGRTGRAGQPGLAISAGGRGGKLNRLAGMELPKLDLGLLPALHQGALPRWACLKISAGRRDKLRPGDVLGALTGEAGGLPSSDVGKIEVQERVTYLAVAHAVVGKAQRGLEDGRIKGMKMRVERI